jgi:hypothetical protein
MLAALKDRRRNMPNPGDLPAPAVNPWQRVEYRRFYKPTQMRERTHEIVAGDEVVHEHAGFDGEKVGSDSAIKGDAAAEDDAAPG